MRSRNEHSDLTDQAIYRELRLLSEVNIGPNVSQRNLSRRLGIALGLTNVLLKNMAEKGYVRITQAGWKRWLYTLTPRGLSRKIRLTVAYVNRFLDHYRAVRQTLREELALLSLNPESRVALFGTGEFAELVYICIKELGIEDVEIYSQTVPFGQRFLGHQIKNIDTLQSDNYDRILLADLSREKENETGLLLIGVPPEKLVHLFSGDPTLPIRLGDHHG